jgi:hypothetical protein
LVNGLSPLICGHVRSLLGHLRRNWYQLDCYPESCLARQASEKSALITINNLTDKTKNNQENNNNNEKRTTTKKLVYVVNATTALESLLKNLKVDHDCMVFIFI